MFLLVQKMMIGPEKSPFFHVCYWIVVDFEKLAQSQRQVRVSCEIHSHNHVALTVLKTISLAYFCSYEECCALIILAEVWGVDYTQLVHTAHWAFSKIMMLLKWWHSCHCLFTRFWLQCWYTCTSVLSGCTHYLARGKTPVMRLIRVRSKDCR